MSKFRKKPVVIEAIKWDGFGYPYKPLFGLKVHPKNDKAGEIHSFECSLDTSPSPLYINTLEGVMRAEHGDWIIKGVKGEFYPCKPDIFEATYEAVE